MLQGKACKPSAFSVRFRREKIPFKKEKQQAEKGSNLIKNPQIKALRWPGVTLQRYEKKGRKPRFSRGLDMQERRGAGA